MGRFSRWFVTAALITVITACVASGTSPRPLPPKPGSTTAPTAIASKYAATTTAPTEEKTIALVIGDFGIGTQAESTVAAAMERYASTRGISALLTTGDNFYIDDVDRIWHQPFGWVDDRAITVLAAWGNHDIETISRQSAVVDALGPPGRWYEASIGPARLLVLDSNLVDDLAQHRWLERALSEHDDGPLIIAFHQPAFSCSKHGSTPEVVEAWVPLFERHGVDLVLNGHDHIYQRFERNGVAYIVTGGGGHALYERKPCSATTPEPAVSYDDDHHFLVLEITDHDVTVLAMRPSDSVIDRATIPNRD